MDSLYDNNKLSMPQQVDKNTKEIAILKKTVSTPAILYNASIEISTSAGVISQLNVIETVSTTDNSYILDTVGSLFKVIDIVDDNIYILYVSSIRGVQGADGENGVGIQSITSIAPTQDDGYTVTPVTFTDTEGNQTTLNVRAKNGEYAQVDDTLSTTSENPVQNKVITDEIQNLFKIVETTVKESIGATGASLTITADNIPNGYKFFCWISFSSSGWLGSLYTPDVNNPTCKVFNAYGDGGGFFGWFLCIKEYYRSYNMDKLQNEICNLKWKLDKTDYQAIKFAEGELTAEEYAPIKEQRKQWRAKINELEKQLKTVSNQ